MDYETFLSTSYQLEKAKERIWKRDKNCKICGGRGADVHHLSYSFGMLPPIEFLILVCRPCHRCWAGESPLHLDHDPEMKKIMERIAYCSRCLRGIKLVGNRVILDKEELKKSVLSPDFPEIVKRYYVEKMGLFD